MRFQNIILINCYLLFSLYADIVIAETNTNPSAPDISSTLALASKDIRSDDAQIRLSAAILLGKYNLPESQSLLINAAKDKNTEVRRAAVISIKEQGRLFSLINAEQLLASLADPDVEVRRAVSSLSAYIGDILNHYARTTLPTPYKYNLPEKLRHIVLESLSDNDDIVRLNMIKSCHRLNFTPPQERIATLLADNNRDVIIATIAALSHIEPDYRVLDALEVLFKQEDPGIQTAIVEILYASSDQKITRLLSNLTQADNHAFRLVHYLLRARSGTAPDEEALKDIAAIISNLNTRNDFFDRLIQETRLFQSGRIDGVLIRHPLESFRLAGWANQANNIGNTDPALLNTGLEDNSLLVRQTLVNALLGAPFSVSPEIWNQMTNSHFADIRMGAAEILTRLGVLTRMEELFPLLIDEDSRVRAAALRVLVKHKPPGWQKILIRSLKDRDGNVQRQSVNHLFASGQEGIGLLQTWEKANRQSALALFIRSEFSRRRISPLAGSEQQRDSVP